MANWYYDANDYSARNFAPIPEGDYRVTIADVTEELFNSGNEGFKITLDVPNHKSKLWIPAIPRRPISASVCSSIPLRSGMRICPIMKTGLEEMVLCE